MNKYNFIILCFILVVSLLSSCSSGEYQRAGILDFKSATTTYADEQGYFNSSFDLSVEEISNINFTQENLIGANLSGSVFYLRATDNLLVNSDQVTFTFKTNLGNEFKIVSTIYIDPATGLGYSYLDDYNADYKKFIRNMINGLIFYKTTTFTISGTFLDKDQNPLPNIPYHIEIRNDLQLTLHEI